MNHLHMICVLTGVGFKNTHKMGIVDKGITSCFICVLLVKYKQNTISNKKPVDKSKTASYNTSMITITLRYDPETGLNVTPEEPIDFSSFLFITSNSILISAKHLVEQVPEEHREAVLGELYDVINLAASNVLHALAPEIDMRKDLTVDAIARAEDELIKENEKHDDVPED